MEEGGREEGGRRKEEGGRREEGEMVVKIRYTKKRR
jgi:hypothetical protein